ncbi:MAG: transcriptional regulator [Candidatus Parcubacteria bacterium]|nr:MAG: transcriptional regulator [Candidatus Parcubacteria bacterium]
MRQEVKQRLVRRLRIIEGQVRGLQQMVERGTYCVDLLAQTAAVKEAISSLENELLHNHLLEHVVAQMRGRESKKAIKEIVKIFRLAKRK